MKVVLGEGVLGKGEVVVVDEGRKELDVKGIEWVEEFLMKFEKRVMVVWDEGEFLNKVWREMGDVDFNKIEV